MKLFTIRGYADFFPDLNYLESKGRLTMSEINGLQKVYLTDVAETQIGAILSLLVDHSESMDFVICSQCEEEM